MNITCAECRFWDRNPAAGNDFHSSGFGLCKAVEYKRRENVSDRIAIATCYSEQIEGELLTKAKFSCALAERASSTP